MFFYSCSAKVAEASELLNECTQCNVTQKFDTCMLHYTACIDIQSDDTVKMFTVFPPTLEDICLQEDVTKPALLLTQPFTTTVSNNIVSI